MSDPLYTYSGPGRMVVYERPEGSDRKRPCLPRTRVHLSASELAAYDGQRGVSFAPVVESPAPEMPPEPPEQQEPSRFGEMTRSELWSAIKHRGLDEELAIDYRSTGADEMLEILNALAE